MDRTEYPAAANGLLTPEGLRQACSHVWRDSNSIVMLGPNVLSSEPVSYDDKHALTALRRHIAAAGPRSFMEDVLPNLGFGRMEPASPIPSLGEAAKGEAAMQQGKIVVEVDDAITCTRCGKETVALHRGCSLCDDCCDCRPAGT